MGQNFPYIQQQGGLPQAGGQGFPQGGMGLPAGLQNPHGGGGFDPRLMETIRQQLQNPNAGDGFAGPAGGAEPPEPFENPFMPGSPTDMLAGGAVGVGIGLGLQKYAEKGGPIKLAQFIEKIPGVKALNGLLENRVLTSSRMAGQPWFQEILLTHAKGKATPHEAAKAARRFMEARQIEKILAPHAKNPEIMNRLGGSRSFAELLRKARKEMAALKATGTKADAKLARDLLGLNNQIKGIKNTYTPMIEAEAKLVHTLEKAGVGPIGKAFAFMDLYIRRIFGGETIKDSMAILTKQNMVAKMLGPFLKKLNMVAKMLGPFLIGSLIIGQSFAKAKKAKEGEKVKTFFHDFFGTGIGMFVGWEVGRKVLRSTGIVSKVLGSWANKLPFRLLPLIGGVTLGGFVVEMLAMFAVAGIFQKAFEKLSHKIFGEPSKESLEGKAKAKPLPSSPYGKPLHHASRYYQMFNRPGAQNTGNPAGQKPLTALSVYEIRQSPAAMRLEQDLQQILSIPWDPNSIFNPFERR